MIVPEERQVHNAAPPPPPPLLTWMSHAHTTAKGISFLKSGKVTALQGNEGKVTGVVVKTGAEEQQILPADLVVVRV